MSKTPSRAVLDSAIRTSARSLAAFRSISGLLLSLGAVGTLYWILHFNTIDLLEYLAPDVRPSANSSSSNWQWSSIRPSRELEWHRCFEHGLFDCARLDLPMDWLDPSDELRVTLAVIRLRADPSAPGEYMGPVFFNPGGPGGSGVWSMQDHGHLLQTIVGSNHDLITFDPRGVGASIPRIDCWGATQKKRLWDLQDVGVLGAHSGIASDAYVRAMAFSSVCEQSMNASGLLEHIGTPYHARDMLEILHQTGHRQLKYWGFSYGTILGGYFASMYPEKVERLVSDGNVDYLEWAENKHINFVRDSDKVMDAFYTYCHEAGPRLCAFHAESPDAIEQRLNKLLADIQLRPILIQPSTFNGPDIPQLITWSHLKRLISRVMYQPLLLFPSFAKILTALEQRNGRPFYNFFLAEDPQASFCSIDAVPPSLPRLEEANTEAYPAIACADGPPNNDTLEDFLEITERLKAISAVNGDVGAQFRLVCVGKKVRPKWRLDGKQFGGKTKWPILYVNNVADNITPMVSARNNSELFPGSVILTQNSYGHTTLAAPSNCTAKHIRAYFQDGSLPADDTACEPDHYPFQEKSAPRDVRHELFVEDDEAVEKSLARASYELYRSNWISGSRSFA